MSTRTIASQPIATPRSGRRPWRTGYSKAQVPRATSMTSSLSMMSSQRRCTRTWRRRILRLFRSLRPGRSPTMCCPRPFPPCSGRGKGRLTNVTLLLSCRQTEIWMAYGRHGECSKERRERTFLLTTTVPVPLTPGRHSNWEQRFLPCKRLKILFALSHQRRCGCWGACQRSAKCGPAVPTKLQTKPTGRGKIPLPTVHEHQHCRAAAAAMQLCRYKLPPYVST